MIDGLEIRQVPWQQEMNRLYGLRKAVFVEEQRVPLELELDEADAQARHFLALLDGNAVGTARLTADGQIGRLAVLKPHRGRSIGAQLMEAVLQHARQRGLHHLFLHAQVQAVSFYQGFGFAATGETFMEAGIAHCHMERNDHG